MSFSKGKPGWEGIGQFYVKDMAKPKRDVFVNLQRSGDLFLTIAFMHLFQSAGDRLAWPSERHVCLAHGL